MRSPFAAVFLLCAATTPVFGDQGLKFSLDGNPETILPLGYSSRIVLGVKRNGYMIQVKPDDIKDPTVLPRFAPFSQSEMRGELLREFGKKFEITGTGNYLVVHPRGARDLWANRFEELYRSMTHFFKTRGYPMSKPQFPLVGVVFPSEAQYLEYGARVLKAKVSNTYGVYVPTTNRIYLYDATQGTGEKSRHWQENLATVMHEVAHQTAFNTGIHVRGAATPVWIAEGLGCLFEAKGIYNAAHYRSREDRINLGRMVAFKKNVAEDTNENFVTKLASTDRWFKYDPGEAYAAAWALTFYLSERQPREYVRYLKAVAQRGAFEEYNENERIQEFAKYFGRDHKMLATRVTRFINDIPIPDHGQ